jgi:hypothetical protein
MENEIVMILFILDDLAQLDAVLEAWRYSSSASDLYQFANKMKSVM